MISKGKIAFGIILISVFFGSCARYRKYTPQELDSIKKTIVSEGELLYKLEKAAWISTDTLMAYYMYNMTDIDSYFSYIDSNGVKSLYLARQNSDSVYVEFDFDKTFKLTNVLDKERAMTDYERNLNDVRLNAIDVMKQDTSLFRFYDSIGVNIVPIYEKIKPDSAVYRVYIMNASHRKHVVCIGNDYLITFNEKKELIEKKRLHNALFVYDFSKRRGRNFVYLSGHQHADSTSEFITPTDYCTLKLYNSEFDHSYHAVVSEHYVSIYFMNFDTIKLERR